MSHLAAAGQVGSAISARDWLLRPPHATRGVARLARHLINTRRCYVIGR